MRRTSLKHWFFFSYFLVRRPVSSFRMSSLLTYKSLLIEPDEKGIQEAANLLKSGNMVAFPTETVYGLGANALNEQAVLNIFKAKGRPLTDPLIVHISKPEEAFSLIEVSSGDLNEKMFNTLSKSFWPGPLTMIMKASSIIPPAITANTGFVGIRCPAHSLARRLIEVSALPIAAPSANRFGHVSPTRAEHVLYDLGEKGVKVINGESLLLSSASASASLSSDDSASASSPSCAFGIESTVVKLDGKENRLIIFRQGAITQKQIENVFRKVGLNDVVIEVMKRAVKMHQAISEENKKEHEDPSRTQGKEGEGSVVSASVGEVAPGQAVTHYAPDVPCYIIRSLICSDQSSSSNSGSSSGIDMMLTEDVLLNDVVLIDYGGKYSSLSSRVLAYRDLSSQNDSSEAARSLFDTLRWAECVDGAKIVLITAVDEQQLSEIESHQLQRYTNDIDMDLSLGVADRIFRAASGLFVNVQIQSNP
jgi:L-threonylcarbamoyladenylate synthase